MTWIGTAQNMTRLNLSWNTNHPLFSSPDHTLDISFNINGPIWLDFLNILTDVSTNLQIGLSLLKIVISTFDISETIGPNLGKLG
jgi:hypothetical protein